MKSEDCNIRNPLIRDGASRGLRFPPALSPRHARVDERTIADFIRFVREYSKTLQFYDGENRAQGDWEAFFSHDVSAALAEISLKDLSHQRRWAAELRALAEEAISPQRMRDMGLFPQMFALLFGMAAETDSWLLATDGHPDFGEKVSRVVASPLREALNDALILWRDAFDKAWFSWPFTLPSRWEWLMARGQSAVLHPFLGDWNETGKGAPANLEIRAAALENQVASRSSEIRMPAPEETRVKLWQRAFTKLLTCFEFFYNAQTRLAAEAGVSLRKTLVTWPGHNPHMALWLAFLRLHQYGQADLNTLTRRHLDFFYRTMLGFRARDARPDKVHVVFELAKGVAFFPIPAGTELKAGKDALGRPVTYRTLAENVINRATIAEPADIKSVFIDTADAARVYAADTAPSADGKGKKFSVPEPKWKPFGISQGFEKEKVGGGTVRDFLPPDLRTMEFCSLGFAVASPILDLREGLRTIILEIKLKSPPDNRTFEAAQFTCRLTGKKGWFETHLEDAPTLGAGTLTFKVILEPTDPAVAPGDPAKLGKKYPADIPVMEILLKNEPTAEPKYAHTDLRDLKADSLKITVDVKGVANLILQSDSGSLKAGKPIQPFGAQPTKGSGLAIGSDEVFRKKPTSVTLHYEWMDAPSDMVTHYNGYILGIAGGVKDPAQFKSRFLVLEKRAWGEAATGVPLFENGTEGSKSITLPIPTGKTGDNGEALLPSRAPDLPPIRSLETDTQQGFIRWELSDPPGAFGHAEYPPLVASTSIRLAKATTQAEITAIKMPLPPYTPFIKSLHLDYASEQTLDFKDPAAGGWERFFHVLPFGCAEVPPGPNGNPLLLPAFESTPEEKNEGELYLGISNLVPPQNLSLYFQVAEGSANPDLPKQDVIWSWLQGNTWVTFRADQVLADTTNGLIASGLLVLAVPAEVDSEHSILPSGKRWLRASVTKNSAAVCSILGVFTQGAEASFLETDNDPAFLASPLPAGSIAQLAAKKAEIKSVSQPYASFGGRMREADREFDVRVSERLRHKNRAVSVWDYEKLVLERFPSIFKAKCINHGTYIYPPGKQDAIVSEFAPGFVTLVVVPDLRNRNAVNPLEPRAAISLLAEIKAYLQGVMPAWAAAGLQVLNPLYETVQAKFKVRFRQGLDHGLYRRRLDEDLRSFLSPWDGNESPSGPIPVVDIHFGGKIHHSTLLHFVEKLEYVDYVMEFTLNHFDGVSIKPGLLEAVPSSARSILVSHAEHNIFVIGES